jgi:hypothetical protein
MPAPPHPGASWTLWLLLPLLAWRVWSRLRRMVGRQRLSKYRPWITLSLFPLLLALLGWASLLGAPARLPWLAGAVLAGLALGRYGLHKTQFEAVRGQGLFYTPNAHLGIALSLLFVLRIAYRLVELFVLDAGAEPSLGSFARSPLTLAVFGLLAGYYIAYAIGLLRWRARVMRAKHARDAQQAHGSAADDEP